MSRGVDLGVEVGGVHLKSPILAASGTSGHGAELGAYVELSTLGAVVAKSLCIEPWAGNRPPRVVPVRAGMLNSVGLQGPGVTAFIDEDLPKLKRAGASVVVSIWGRSVSDFARASEALHGVRDSLTAVEVNISCPNVEDGSTIFAHSPSATRDVLEATAACGLPRWAKLSPNVTDVVEIATAAVDGGASAVTLVNTVLGLDIDIERRRPMLAMGRGGLSGPAIRTVALRAVYDCFAAIPGLAIVGVGGVTTGEEAVALMMAGASAVEIGTATLLDPRATARILLELTKWCQRHKIGHVRDLTGVAHAP